MSALLIFLIFFPFPSVCLRIAHLSPQMVASSSGGDFVSVIYFLSLGLLLTWFVVFCCLFLHLSFEKGIEISTSTLLLGFSWLSSYFLFNFFLLKLLSKGFVTASLSSSFLGLAFCHPRILRQILTIPATVLARTHYLIELWLGPTRDSNPPLYSQTVFYDFQKHKSTKAVNPREVLGKKTCLKHK